jgi:hypothetical protein
MSGYYFEIDWIHVLHSVGNLWIFLTVLDTFVLAIDTILGLLIAINPRLRYIKFSSTTLIQRLWKKVVIHQALIMFAVIIHAITCAVGDISSWLGYASILTTSFFIGIILLAEFGSILENLKVLGVRWKVFGIDVMDIIIDKWADTLRRIDDDDNGWQP